LKELIFTKTILHFRKTRLDCLQDFNLCHNLNLTIFNKKVPQSIIMINENNQKQFKLEGLENLSKIIFTEPKQSLGTSAQF